MQNEIKFDNFTSTIIKLGLLVLWDTYFYSRPGWPSQFWGVKANLTVEELLMDVWKAMQYFDMKTYTHQFIISFTFKYSRYKLQFNLISVTLRSTWTSSELILELFGHCMMISLSTEDGIEVKSCVNTILSLTGRHITAKVVRRLIFTNKTGSSLKEKYNC